jgi:oxygen-independent coproporphyrinogen-3 oxidase
MNELPPLGVYVHWPYCTRICPYCDFNVYKTRETDPARWAEALARDLEHWAARIPKRKLTSLYFGGGTPSLAPVSVIAAVVEACARTFGFEPGAEITLEANPTDAEQSRFAAFAATGVNRLSLGVQSLRDGALEFLGRNHDAQTARRAIAAAQTSFCRVTFDLIYARPGQTLEDWRAELAEALSFGTEHLSLYQLTIEPGTAFAKAVAEKRWAGADEDACAEQFDLAEEMTKAAGLPAYEISNHARAGAQSRHNLLYWRYQDYVGVGPGAHGRLTINGARIATKTHDKPEDYLAKVKKTGTGAEAFETLGAEAQLVERLTMGLRLTEGVALYADDVFYAAESRVEQLHRLIDLGLLRHDCGQLRATPDGRRVLNRIVLELLG